MYTLTRAHSYQAKAHPEDVVIMVQGLHYLHTKQYPAAFMLHLACSLRYPC